MHVGGGCGSQMCGPGSDVACRASPLPSEALTRSGETKRGTLGYPAEGGGAFHGPCGPDRRCPQWRIRTEHIASGTFGTLWITSGMLTKVGAAVRRVVRCLPATAPACRRRAGGGGQVVAILWWAWGISAVVMGAWARGQSGRRPVRSAGS